VSSWQIAKKIIRKTPLKTPLKAKKYIREFIKTEKNIIIEQYSSKKAKQTQGLKARQVNRLNENQNSVQTIRFLYMNVGFILNTLNCFYYSLFLRKNRNE